MHFEIKQPSSTEVSVMERQSNLTHEWQILLRTMADSHWVSREKRILKNRPNATFCGSLKQKPQLIGSTYLV